MSASPVDVISEYLREAIDAERGFETRLRSSSEAGEDPEVQGEFRRTAAIAAHHAELLEKRLSSLNVSYKGGRSVVAELLAMAPKAAQFGHISEENIVQNLTAGFSISRSGRAMYQALQSAARAAGDEQTSRLAGELGEEHEGAAQNFFHLIPSRSKIAFNMLTAGEVDPSVETRAPDDRLTDKVL